MNASLRLLASSLSLASLVGCSDEPQFAPERDSGSDADGGCNALPCHPTSDAASDAPDAPPQLEGTVARAGSAPIAEGSDGIGTLYVAVLARCALDAERLGAAIIEDADLSDTGTRVSFAIPDLPAGEVHLAFFLDDTGDADPSRPLPSPGDLVFADGVGDGILSCVSVPADAKDVELVLNVSVPLG